MDGQTLTFELNGVRGSNFVMRDQQTQSDWQQATGEAFSGPHEGRRLELVPFRITTWGEWRARHPRTLAFVIEPEFREQYQLMARRMADMAAFGAPGRPALSTDTRLSATVQIHGIEAPGGYKAYPVSLLGRQPLLNEEVAMPVLIIHNAATETNRAYSRRLDAQLDGRSGGRPDDQLDEMTLTFEPAGPGPVVMTDRETHSEWNADGECVRGEFEGRKLEMVTLYPSFWFSWAAFHSGTELYGEPSR